MANTLILDGTQQTLTVGFDADITGTAAAETVLVEDGANVGFSAQSGDRVDLAQQIGDYTIERTGLTELTLTDSSGDTITLNVNQGQQFGLRFQDGDATVDLTSNGIEISGGQSGTETLANTGDQANPSNVTLGNDNSQVGGGTGTPGGGGTGDTFTLTQGADTGSAFTGGSGDEQFNAFLDGGAATFQPNLDRLDGGGGNDTLTAFGLDTGTVGLDQAVDNIENLVFRATGTSDFDLTDVSSVESLESQGSSDDLTFTDISNADVTVAVNGVTGGVTTFDFATGVFSSASDTLDIEVSNTDSSAGSDDFVLSGGTAETLNITSSGGASSLDQDFNGATTLNVTGDADLTLAEANTSVETVSAGSFTGALSANLTGNSNDISFTTGSGNDELIHDHDQIDDNDSIDLGGGSEDRLVLDAEFDALTTAEEDAINNNVSGVEELAVSSVASNTDILDASVFNNIDAFSFEAGAYTTGTDGTTTIAANNVNSGDRLTFTSAVAGHTGNTAGENAIDLTGASAGQSVELVLEGNVNGGDANTSGAGGDGIAVQSGITSLTLDASAANLHVAGGATAGGGDGFAVSGVSNINVTGDEQITLGGPGTTNGTASGPAFADGINLNASNQSGGVVADLADDGSTGDVFTGGSGADIISGGTGNDQLNGGAGDDDFDGGAGGDTLVGGDGDDRLDGGVDSTSDTLTGNAGQDTFELSDTEAADDITDHEVGTDTIELDVSDLNGDGSLTQLEDSSDAVTAGDSVVIGTLANGGTLSAAQVDNDTNVFQFTDTSGINSSSDLAFDITLDQTPDDNDGVVVAFYDADDSEAVVSILRDDWSADGDGNVTDGDNNIAFDEIATVGMSASEFSNLSASDFAFG